ncbi:MAG: hypothetical protein VKP57_07990 [Candidatus Sericytochromatia bacterium]|nr:hypothetical protein [Candidatus Sericytochromatia bacterium]
MKGVSNGPSGLLKDVHDVVRAVQDRVSLVSMPGPSPDQPLVRAVPQEVRLPPGLIGHDSVHHDGDIARVLDAGFKSLSRICPATLSIPSLERGGKARRRRVPSRILGVELLGLEGTHAFLGVMGHVRLPDRGREVLRFSPHGSSLMEGLQWPEQKKSKSEGERTSAVRKAPGRLPEQLIKVTEAITSGFGIRFEADVVGHDEAHVRTVDVRPIPLPEELQEWSMAELTAVIRMANLLLALDPLESELDLRLNLHGRLELRDGGAGGPESSRDKLRIRVLGCRLMPMGRALVLTPAGDVATRRYRLGRVTF